MEWQRKLKTFVEAIVPPILLPPIRFVYRSLKPSRHEVPDERARDADWYDARYASEEAYRIHYTATSYYFLWCVVAERMEQAGVGSVLEIGCGSGQFACLLRDRGMERYWGFDASRAAVELARSTCPQYEFFVANALQTDLYTRLHYDAAICMEVLEHIEEDLDVLRNIPQGTTFFGTVPNFPYVSHVRHFADCAEVAERYGALFQDFRVDALLANERGKRYFLFQGVKH